MFCFGFRFIHLPSIIMSKVDPTSPNTPVVCQDVMLGNLIHIPLPIQTIFLSNMSLSTTYITILLPEIAASVFQVDDTSQKMEPNNSSIHSHCKNTERMPPIQSSASSFICVGKALKVSRVSRALLIFSDGCSEWKDYYWYGTITRSRKGTYQ